MDTNLSLYRIFYTVANAGNISKAARELYISQPAISKAISKLESNLETTLFIRNSRGVTLTEEGKLMYEYIRNAFDILGRAEQELTRMKNLELGHIRIGVSTTLCKYILIPYLERYIQQHPHIKISIENQASAQTIAMLEQQHLDIGLIAKPKYHKGLRFYPVMEIEDIFVCTPKYLEHLKLRAGSLDNLLQTGTIMLLNNKNMTRHHIDSYLTEHQVHLRHTVEVSTMDLLIEFAKIGLGIACCIKEYVQKDLDNGTLVQVPLDIPIPKRTVGFALEGSTPPIGAVTSFLDFIMNEPTEVSLS